MFLFYTRLWQSQKGNIFDSLYVFVCFSVVTKQLNRFYRMAYQDIRNNDVRLGLQCFKIPFFSVTVVVMFA